MNQLIISTSSSSVSSASLPSVGSGGVGTVPLSDGKMLFVLGASLDSNTDSTLHPGTGTFRAASCSSWASLRILGKFAEVGGVRLDVLGTMESLELVLPGYLAHLELFGFRCFDLDRFRYPRNSDRELCMIDIPAPEVDCLFIEAPRFFGRFESDRSGGSLPVAKHSHFIISIGFRRELFSAEKVPYSPSATLTRESMSPPMSNKIPPLCTGYLSKRGAKLELWVPRFFVLYQDTPKVYYYDDFDNWKSAENPSGSIDLVEFKSFSLEQTGRRGLIELHTKTKSYRLLAENMNEALRWKECIEQVIRD